MRCTCFECDLNLSLPSTVMQSLGGGVIVGKGIGGKHGAWKRQTPCAEYKVFDISSVENNAAAYAVRD